MVRVMEFEIVTELMSEGKGDGLEIPGGDGTGGRDDQGTASYALGEAP